MKILAIDPGTTQSGWCILYQDSILGSGVMPNEDMRLFLKQQDYDVLAIEMIASYGMPVGKEVFETCLWIGRFIELSSVKPELIYRQDVKMVLCGSMKAKDPNIKQRIIDLMGEPGTKAAPGKTYGVKSHAWSALAVALTYQIKTA